MNKQSVTPEELDALQAVKNVLTQELLAKAAAENKMMILATDEEVKIIQTALKAFDAAWGVDGAQRDKIRGMIRNMNSVTLVS